jgi:hypothetical protein
MNGLDTQLRQVEIVVSNSGYNVVHLAVDQGCWFA